MNPDVVCATPEMSVGETLQLLLDRDVFDAPVVDEHGRMVGVISQSALMRHVKAPTTAAQSGHFFTEDDDYRELGNIRTEETQTPVEEVMRRKMHPVTRETGVAVAANIMRERQLHRLFVTDGGKLVGVVTSLDLLRIVEELG